MVNRASLTPDTQVYLNNEIKILSSLKNENIVTLYDVQKTDRNYYLIMDYCAGGDLEKFIKLNGPVDEETGKRWIH